MALRLVLCSFYTALCTIILRMHTPPNFHLSGRVSFFRILVFDKLYKLFCSNKFFLYQEVRFRDVFSGFSYMFLSFTEILFRNLAVGIGFGRRHMTLRVIQSGTGLVKLQGLLAVELRPRPD